ncbi:hypothetical protein [uncultured Thiodictyon sp.]|uniref:hypothetical protein n=1 Tax=uncultured Thiodictyon sp. TaxID=1846217 RepID=UPI0025FA8631|nr:hypothetical protein [uncultured Thiodictyon sp.]
MPDHHHTPDMPPTAAANPRLDPRLFMSFPSVMARLFSIMNPVLVQGQGLVVQFIGTQYGDGVSTIARDFALTTAQHIAGPVLLLDFDWGQDSHFIHFQRIFKQQGANINLELPLHLDIDLSGLLGMPGGPSPASCPLRFDQLPDLGLILGRTDFSQTVTPAPTLSILNRPDIWALLRGKFATIVVDSPPSSQSFDGIVLSGAMDAVVLVVRAESTRSPVAAHLRDRLTARGAPLAGVVLNQRRFYIPKFIYRFLDRL